MMKEQVSRLMVMKNQVFRECRVNLIEETDVVMKKQVFRECGVNYNERAGVNIDSDDESMIMEKHDKESIQL